MQVFFALGATDHFAAADAQADEVVEIAVGQALDVQMDRRAFDLQSRTASDVELLLPNRQRLQWAVFKPG
jgi:hypothetical protein